MKRNLNIMFLFIEVFVNKGYTRRISPKYRHLNRMVTQRIITDKAALMLGNYNVSC